MATVLIVEDDNIQARKVERALDDMGVTHKHAASAEDALRICRRHRFEMFLIDTGLPGVDGFSFARKVRDHTNAAVIFMGEADSEAQKVFGFELGADDYLVKPFGMLELSCRIKAVLRRCSECRPVKVYDMDSEAHTVEVDGEVIHLSPIEFRLFRELILAGGSTVSRAALIRNVWGDSSYATDHTLKERVRSLRRKVGQCRVQNVYGEGYRIVPKE